MTLLYLRELVACCTAVFMTCCDKQETPGLDLDSWPIVFILRVATTVRGCCSGTATPTTTDGFGCRPISASASSSSSSSAYAASVAVACIAVFRLRLDVTGLLGPYK